MLKSIVYKLIALVLMHPLANAGEAYTIDDYNASLVKYGIPFYTHYPASFYTGFAPRVEEPNRIHYRAGRGNQIRLTAILDEFSVLTYLYSLTKRYDHVANHSDLPDITLHQIEHFFEHYKDLEPGKWVKIGDWLGADKARAMITQAIERAGRPSD